ncbi:MAG: metal-dependent hydrolase [Clostridia bacterium]|nr:metal-dependent hydrolase [Clostridia bacterium]
MKITYLGHSGFLLTGKHGQIVIDPLLTGYPFPTFKPEDIKANLILISHGHGDHFGDSVEIAGHSGGTIVSNYEIANYCADQGVNTHPLHLGGSRDFNLAKIKLTIAFHGSSMGLNPAQYMGNPAGFLITMDGLNIYHAGDTGLFGDMELIGRLHPIDVAMLPIGDNFTMGPEDALEAVKMLRPKVAIPMHYNTWPLIAQDPQAFKSAVEAATETKVVVLAAKEEYNL